MRLAIRSATLLLGAALLSSACQTYGPAAEVAVPTEGGVPGLNGVVFVDAALQRTVVNSFASIRLSSRRIHKLSLVDIGKRRADSGFASVWATMRNHTSFALPLEARSIFFATDGRPAGPPTEWQPLWAPANGVIDYRGLSASVHAQDFVIELREGR